MGKRGKGGQSKHIVFPLAKPDGQYMNGYINHVPGATGYIIYGIAPIPVHIAADECVRVEPTANGYNLYNIEDK